MKATSKKSAEKDKDPSSPSNNSNAKNKADVSNINNKNALLIGLALILFVYLVFFRSSGGELDDEEGGYAGLRTVDGESDGGDEDSYGLVEKKPKKKSEDNGEEEEMKKKPKLEKPKSLAPGPVHPVEKIISASTQASGLMAPFKIMNNMAICPNGATTKNNVQCTKGFVEFRFKAKQPGRYYLYVETFAPSLLDNSLWTSPPLDPVNGNELSADDEQLKTFLQCETKQKPGPLVPHKHTISSKKFECCPKYLAKNAKKGMSAFYSDCCYASVGPYGDGLGCVFDLEMDKVKPLWNLVPRPYLVKDVNKMLVIRLYGREDGTGVTRVMLSANGNLKEIN